MGKGERYLATVLAATAYSYKIRYNKVFVINSRHKISHTFISHIDEKQSHNGRRRQYAFELLPF